MFFPVLVDLKKILVFGGGDVGCRKVQLFLDYMRGEGVGIIVVSEDFDWSFAGVEYVRARVTQKNMSGFIGDDVSLVVSALSSRDLNEMIAGECRRRNILVNVVDSPELCSVIFPAVLREGDLVVSVSTLGRCPFYSRRVKEELSGFVRERAAVVDILADVRESCIDSGLDVKKVLGSICQDEVFNDHIGKADFESARKRASEIVGL